MGVNQPQGSTYRDSRFGDEIVVHEYVRFTRQERIAGSVSHKTLSEMLRFPLDST